MAMRRPFILEIDVGQRLSLGVADAEAFGGLVDLPRRREAAVLAVPVLDPPRSDNV